MENPKPTYANLTTNRSSRNSRIRLQPKPHEIQNGKYMVSFSKEENEMLAQTCKWTILGKFSQIRPSIDIIRREFTKIIPGKGNIKIGAYDMHHVFLDLTKSRTTSMDGLTEMINQRIEYDIIPTFCSHCKMQGHRDENCRKLHTNLQTKEAENTLSEQKIVQATTNVASTIDTTNLRDSTTQNSKESPDEINEEQEWKTVTNRKGKYINKSNSNGKISQTNQDRGSSSSSEISKMQEKVLSQKGRIKWLEDGDTNSAFFHRVIKDKRKRLSIHKIKDQEGNWVEGTTQVADVAVNFFTNLFKVEPTEEDSNNFNHVERFVTIEDNNNLNSLPTLREIKDTIFSIDSDSASGTDGLNGKFYQSTWQIIASDLHAAINSFFQGAILPKNFSHTCIVMLPKVNSPQEFF
ncbi:hypothetical protein MTR67_012304 [Solanum verrucosum]|uniref:Uncharacterized protein n=1 Tax=Solanum verrucosum TaxID=315347 RepID=A0AAF0QFG2_SOLVR|nr:hypothetical protein MTR67_012304 [Solanum verrucosum]